MFCFLGDINSATQAERSDAEWKDVQARNKTHDTIRDDSRYTGTSGRNRKSFITHFRDSIDSSREHNAIDSRASGFATTTRSSSFGARRSKIDDIWTTSEFKAPSVLSRTNVLGKITEIDAVRNSNKPDGALFSGLSNNSRFILASNKSFDLGVDRTIGYSGKVNSENLERSKSDEALNQNFKLTVARTRYSSGGNSAFDSGIDNISIAKNRQKSSSIKSESFSNKRIIGNNTLRWRTGQASNILSSKISNDPRESAISTHSIHRKDHKPILKGTDSIVTLHENVKPNFITDSFRHVVDSKRDDLNNSRELTRPILISNPKSKFGYDVSRRHATTSNRNFVRLRYPFSTLNRGTSNVVLNSKLKNDDNVQRESMKNHLTRTAAKRPALNDRATFDPMKYHYSSHAQNLSGQVERVDGGDTTRDDYDSTSMVQHNAYLKNWPNETFQDIEDLYNYEKYTSSLEDNSNHDSGFHDAIQTPMILSSNDDYYNHPDPVIDASVKKIINWLKVSTIVPNDTQFTDDSDDVRKPVESVFESIYENLEPNRPLSVSDHDNDRYETVVLQDAPQSQDLDEINYHEEYQNSAVHSQYATDSANLSPALTFSSWSNPALLRNKTVYNPTTHVTQNTVVHILNDGLRESNKTQSKVPQSNTVSTSQVVSSSDQKPNVHIMFEKDKENKKPFKQETNTLPSSYNCPTITINTYTRVNNTIQSKEGCTDLNIIVNSHVLTTNVLKPSGEPTELGQQTLLATESYSDTDESDKYVGDADDLSHQDSSNSYVTAPIGTYSSLDAPRPGQSLDYYDSQKNPGSILDGNDPVSSEVSTFEVFQNTQISLLGSGASLTDSEATAGSVADGPVGSSIDGPAVGDDAVVPPAVSASGPPVAGNPGFVNVPSVKPSSLSNSITGQANNGPGSLQLPALPSRPGLSSTGSLSSSQGSSGSSSHNDDDDDDDFDMSPSGMLKSVASVFTYFSLLNPLGYGFFSLAAAPFAAMAASVLGVAAVIFPWAIPNVIDFGRAADKVTIRFRPNLEEFVKQAVHKYNGLNEWKSRRKKRRR